MQASTVHVNVVPGGMPVVLHISQYDVGLREYVFTLYSTQGTWEYVAGATATLEATKPDNHAVVHGCTYNNDGTISYTLQDQLAAVVGRVWSKLVLRDTNDNVLGTVAILWIVDPAGVSDSAIVSDSDLSALQNFVEEFGTINAYKTALDSCLAAIGGTRIASTAADMTDHDFAYVYTGSEAGYVSGNWYYWDGSAWTSGGVYQANYNLDTTLTQSGKAADAKAAGDAITQLKNYLSEPTKNINTASIGKFDTNSSGTITTVNASIGMSVKVACDSSTTYTASYYDATCSGNPTGHISTYDTSGTFIERSSITASDGAVTFTTGATAKYVHVAFYKSGGGFTFGDNAGIQIEKGSIKTAYVPPILPKGTDEINAISEKVDAISEDFYNVFKLRINEPSAFTWKTSPIHGKLSRDYRDNIFVDFDVADYKNAIGTVMYVSPSGSETNDGLSASTPKLKIKTAYDAGANTIILLPGIYRRANTLFSTPITRSLNIIGDNTNGDVIVSTNSVSNMSILSGYTHVYSASRGTFTGVIDINNKNEYGDYTQYVKKTSIADVEATEGSWAHISGTAYVHTIGDVAPTEANGILLLSGGSTYPMFLFQGDGVLYMENIICLEGSSPLRATAQSSASDITVYAKGCRFMYSYDTDNDACMMQGTKLSIFQNCEASYALKDGFNYHAKESIIPKAVEINCIAKCNGNADDANDQGSTIHDGGSIIRVNDICFGSYGSNYAEQGTGSESWNINCSSIESNSSVANQNANFFAYDGVNVFLDSCTGYGSTYNVNVVDTGAIYLRNPKLTGTLAPEGVTPIYY